MNVRHLDAARDTMPDLLSREPDPTERAGATWAHLLVDPVRQLEALAELYRSGLLSRTEFERYKRYVRDP